MPTRSTVRTTVSRDPALVAMLAAHPDYPGPVAIIDAADRAWLRERGVDVPPREPAVPLTVLAREARRRKAAEGGTPRGFFAERARLSGEGRACPRDMACQLPSNHRGECDPRDPQDRPGEGAAPAKGGGKKKRAARKASKQGGS